MLLTLCCSLYCYSYCRSQSIKYLGDLNSSDGNYRLQRMLHSVLTARIILHLREVSTIETGTVFVKSTLHFYVPQYGGDKSEDSELSEFSREGNVIGVDDLHWQV